MAFHPDVSSLLVPLAMRVRPQPRVDGPVDQQLLQKHLPSLRERDQSTAGVEGLE